MWRYLIVLLVAVIATLITMSSMKSGWYSQGVIVSNRQPPRYVFGIVWTFLYITYAIVWNYLANHGMPEWLDNLFLLNMGLNLLWVFVFFGLGNIILSQLIIVALLILTVYQAYAVWNYMPECTKHVGISTLMLVLYSTWLIIATTLNSKVVKI